MKRVLFVTYYFPPSGGPGVQRSLKFVKYLADFGWQATVLTVDPKYAAYPNLDPKLTLEVPGHVSVLKTKAWDPYAAYAKMMGTDKEDAVGVGFLSSKKAGIRERLARWIRANVFLPDGRIGWVKYATKEAKAEVDRQRYDAIFSSGPPHSTHLIAHAVKRDTGLPWILDLRDAWPPDSFSHLLPMSDFARRLDARKRRSSFESANLLVVVSESLGKDAAALTATPVEIIPNGYDEEDIIGVDPICDDGFTIVYVGNISAEQNPTALWHAIKQKKSVGAWSNLSVRLVGNVAVEIRKAIEEAGLGQSVDFVDYVEHGDAIRYMKGADILLLCINRVPNPAGIVTGKLYEYVASGRPILCFSPVQGDASDIVAATKAGESVEYEDTEAVIRLLDRHYESWESGQSIEGSSPEFHSEYSRRRQAEKLASLLDGISHVKR